MKEPFIIEINGTNQLINVSCEAEARYISKKVNGKIKGPFSVEDYKIINMINGSEEQTYQHSNNLIKSKKNEKFRNSAIHYIACCATYFIFSFLFWNCFCWCFNNVY